MWAPSVPAPMIHAPPILLLSGMPSVAVVAPGTEIVAANGFAHPDEPWIAMTGTSMASPFVTGVIGLMLAQEPKLTSAQIEGILRRTARPLPGASFAWATDAGYGRIDPEACLTEVRYINTRKDLG